MKWLTLGSPAERAGIRVGDVIDCKSVAYRYSVGETTKILAFRNREPLHVTLPVKSEREMVQALAASCPATLQVQAHEISKPPPAQTVELFGATLSELTTELRIRFNVKTSRKGLIVTAVQPNSVWDMDGVTPGIIIWAVGGVKYDEITIDKIVEIFDNARDGRGDNYSLQLGVHHPNAADAPEVNLPIQLCFGHLTEAEEAIEDQYQQRKRTECPKQTQ